MPQQEQGGMSGMGSAQTQQAALAGREALMAALQKWGPSS
jgi:hypothetical protein